MLKKMADSIVAVRGEGKRSFMDGSNVFAVEQAAIHGSTSSTELNFMLIK
jgi:hypothetical protein